MIFMMESSSALLLFKMCTVFFIVCLFMLVLGMKPKTLEMLGNHSTTKLHPYPLKYTHLILLSNNFTCRYLYRKKSPTSLKNKITRTFFATSFVKKEGMKEGWMDRRTDGHIHPQPFICICLQVKLKI